MSPAATVRMTVSTPEEMEHLGARIAALLEPGDLIALDGELGAGKTTLVRGLGTALGVRGTITSPTFVLARTHPRPGGAPLVHVDAYRLSSAAELDDLDIDYERSIVVVEWAAGMLDGVADSWLEVGIRRPVGGAPGALTGDGGVTGDDGVEPREVAITPHGPRWRAGAWATTVSGVGNRSADLG